MFLFVCMLSLCVSSKCVSREQCNEIRSYANYWKTNDDDVYHDADLITKGLYLGNVCAAHDEQWLIDNHITVVISVAKEWKPGACRFESSIKQLYYDIDDRNDEDEERVTRQFDEVARVIDHHIKQEENVLIHCNMGISRSTTAVVRYLQLKHPKKSYNTLLQLVKQKRPVATPNKLFSRILIASDSQKDL